MEIPVVRLFPLKKNDRTRNLIVPYRDSIFMIGEGGSAGVNIEQFVDRLKLN